MNDLRALRNAFDELERRADVASLRMSREVPTRVRPSASPRSRLVPVAAGVAVVAGVAAAVLLPSQDAPVTAPAASLSAPASTTTATTTTQQVAKPPTTPEALTERLRTILGTTATFTVTHSDTSGEGNPRGDFVAITGTMTAGDATGGFDLKYHRNPPQGFEPVCEKEAGCSKTTLPDGSELLTSEYRLDIPNGLNYSAVVVRPDKVIITLIVSNAESAKGMGEVHGPRPPLTLEQVEAVVLSDLW